MTDPVTQTRHMQDLVAELWRLEGAGVDTHVGDLAWQRFQQGAERAVVYSAEGFGGGTALYESIDMREYERTVELTKKR